MYQLQRWCVDMDQNKIICSAISGALSISLIVSGLVGLKKDEKCDITSAYHAHLYQKEINDNVVIKKWLCEEKDKKNGFSKTNEFMLTTTEDQNVYNYISNLFDARDNIDYLNYQLRINKDYMEYYYHYTELVTKTRVVTDSKGNSHTEIYTENVTYSGWSYNRYHRGNTGRLRVCHYRYKLNKLVFNEDETYKIISSEYVDDPREITDEYPYSSLNNDTIVYTEFDFSKYELPYIKLEDIDPYYQPVVENGIILKNKMN